MRLLWFLLTIISMNFFKNRPTLLIYPSLFILCCLLTIPPFLHNYMVGHDMLYHLNWNTLFQTQLFQGDLYPRWLFDMKGGRGSPVFYFYSPLPYYFSAFFSLLIPSAQSAWYSLGTTYLFALFVSALGMFWFFKSHAETKYAYAFTVFYILFPYHLVVDLYIRFAFAEFFAITWIPYIFICLQKLIRGEKKAVYALAILYALLILSHIPTTLLMTPFFIVFALTNTRNSALIRSILSGFTLGAALTAFYLLPILFLKKFVSIDRMMTGDLLYKNSFLFIGNVLHGERYEFWTLLENLSLISILVTFLAFYAASKSDKNVFFYFTACLFCLAMMYPFSKPLWEVFPLLNIVQLPWRFYIVLSFLLFMLSVYSSEPGQRTSNLIRWSRFLTIILLLCLSTVTLYGAYNKSTKEIASRHQKIIERTLKARDGVQEYLPAATPEVYYEKVSRVELDRVENLFSGMTAPVTSTYNLHGDQITASIENHLSQSIILHQFYFPTWRGYDLKANRALELTRSKDGFLEFTLNKGRHNLRFEHASTAAEILGISISALMIVFVSIGLIRGLKKGQRCLTK